MPDVLEVAKKPKGSPVPTGPGDDEVTTWKCYQRVAKNLRIIGAHLNLNQEKVLDLFAEAIENYLITLQTEDMEQRTRRKRQE